jgi:hypothetical protein
MPQNWEYNESVGNMRLRKRHESLSLRKHDATSITRATSVSHENVKAFLGNLNELMSRHKFSANKIYNLYDTGNSTVHALPKIICAKGIKQVRSVT